MNIKGFIKTDKILTREELSDKYICYPIPRMDNPTEYDYINYYKNYIKILEELKEDLNKLCKKSIKESCEFTEKQLFCRKKCI